jgi:hypothetical protein
MVRIPTSKGAAMQNRRRAALGVLASLVLALPASAGPGATGSSSACGDLRERTGQICSDFAAGKDPGIACNVGFRYLQNDESECGNWLGSLDRMLAREKQSGLDEPWTWGPSCTEYLERLTTRCIEPLASAGAVDGCQEAFKALEFDNAKWLRIRQNKYMQEEVEKHCAAGAH